MRLAIVLVHFHAAELTAEALEALRRDLAGSGVGSADVEWVVVDNGSDAGERELLASLPVRLLTPPSNLGFAGGIGAGMAATSAPSVLLMNPDVLVQPGCAAALLAELASGAAAAGPRFVWDRRGRLLLPPSERRGRWSEVLSVLARRGSRWSRRARAAWRRHAWRHWTAEGSVESYALSGALLAVSRSAWERVGPFDEGYPLYFEETDWLMRLARAGLAARYVPAARAVHLHGESARREPRAEAWFRESAERFRKRWYGPRFAGVLRSLDRPGRPVEGLPERAGGGLDLAPYAGRGELWVEVSPSPLGYPAAAERLRPVPRGVWRLPEEIDRRLAGSRLTGQVVDRRGRELSRFRWAAGRSPSPPGGSLTPPSVDR